MQRRFRETDSNWVRDELSRYQNFAPCETCDGYRLKPVALAVKIDGLHIGQVTEKSISDARTWFESLPNALTPKAKRSQRAS
jgi:excinuclease ABC subunit A